MNIDAIVLAGIVNKSSNVDREVLLGHIILEYISDLVSGLLEIFEFFLQVNCELGVMNNSVGDI